MIIKKMRYFVKLEGEKWDSMGEEYLRSVETGIVTLSESYTTDMNTMMKEIRHQLKLSDRWSFKISSMCPLPGKVE